QFFAKDHLGSVTEVTNNSGALLGRYAFDPWGRRTLVAGADVTTVGYTGHRAHEPSGTYLALYRAYDPGLGRWLSEDPTGLSAGLNLLAYVAGNPSNSVDLLGLEGLLTNLSGRTIRVKLGGADNFFFDLPDGQTTAGDGAIVRDVVVKVGDWSDVVISVDEQGNVRSEPKDLTSAVREALGNFIQRLRYPNDDDQQSGLKGDYDQWTSRHQDWLDPGRDSCPAQ
ncbi:MAG: RHS repeat-associated core domain-containing protein, partial [Vicinamibacterales bacterium]